MSSALASNPTISEFPLEILGIPVLYLRDGQGPPRLASPHPGGHVERVAFAATLRCFGFTRRSGSGAAVNQDEASKSVAV